MSIPTTEAAREAAEELPEDSVGGLLTFADDHKWFDPARPNHIGVAGLKKYLSIGKPPSFLLRDAFLFARLEEVLSKNEIDEMAERLSSRTEDVQPHVHEEIEDIRSKGGYQKRALGVAMKPQVPDGLEEKIEEDVPEWLVGALFYQQPSSRMIGPEIGEMELQEFVQQFTDGGHIFVFEPGESYQNQLFAGIEIIHSNR